MKTTKLPKIGVPRIYTGPTIDVLYPGEEAHVIITPNKKVIEDWIVEPMPGFHGWYLRMKYRITRINDR